MAAHRSGVIRVQYSSTCSNHVSTFDDLANTSGGQPIPEHRLLLCSPIEALVCITNDYEPSQIVKWFFSRKRAKIPAAIEIAEPQLHEQPNDLAVHVHHVSTFDDLANTSGGQPIPEHRLLLCSPIEALVCITNDYEPSQIVKWFFSRKRAKIPAAIEIAEPQLHEQPNDLAVHVQYSSTCSSHVSTFDDLANTSGGQPIPEHRLLLCSPIEALLNGSSSQTAQNARSSNLLLSRVPYRALLYKNIHEILRCDSSVAVTKNCSMSDSVSTTEFVTNFPLRKLFCCHLKFATFQPTENSWTLLVDGKSHRIYYIWMQGTLRMRCDEKNVDKKTVIFSDSTGNVDVIIPSSMKQNVSDVSADNYCSLICELVDKSDDGIVTVKAKKLTPLQFERKSILEIAWATELVGYIVGCKVTLVELVAKLFFHHLGLLIAKYPLPFVIGPVLITVAGMAGIYLNVDLGDIDYDTSMSDFFPDNSQSWENMHQLQSVFPTNDDELSTAEASSFFGISFIFLRRNLVYATLTSSRPNGSVVSEHGLRCVSDLIRRLKEIQVEHRGVVYKWQDLCYKRAGGGCVEHPLVQTLTLLGNAGKIRPLMEPLLGYPTVTLDNVQMDNTPVLGRVTNGDANGKAVVRAAAFRVPMLLREPVDDFQDELNNLWREQFLKTVRKIRYPGYNVHCLTWHSVIEEIERNGQMLSSYFPYLITILAVLTIGGCCDGDPITSKPWLGVFGLISATFAILTAVGILFHCRYNYISMVMMMPFLVLSVSVDNVFLMLSAWRETRQFATIDERVAETVANSAVSILITALTDGLSFGIGNLTPFPAVQISNGEDQQLQIRWPVLQKFNETLSSTMASVLCNSASKYFVSIIYLLYVGVVGYGMAGLEVGTAVDDLLPGKSYVAATFKANDRYFSAYGDFAVAFVDQPFNLADSELVERHLNLYRSLTSTVHSSEGQFWLQQFFDYMEKKKRDNVNSPNRADNDDQRLQLSLLLGEFFQLAENRHLASDVQFNDKVALVVERSKMTVRLRHVGRSNYSRIASLLRRRFQESALSGFVFHPTFLLIDQDESVWRTLFQDVAVAVLIMTATVALFVSSLSGVVAVGLAVCSISAGVVALLSLWQVRVDIISMITITMSVGLSVDYVAHVAYHYVSGFLATAGVSVLILVDSRMVETFVKTVLLAVTVGMFHGLVFLPTLLPLLCPAAGDHQRRLETRRYSPAFEGPKLPTPVPVPALTVANNNLLLVLKEPSLSSTSDVDSNYSSASSRSQRPFPLVAPPAERRHSAHSGISSQALLHNCRPPEDHFPNPKHSEHNSSAGSTLVPVTDPAQLLNNFHTSAVAVDKPTPRQPDNPKPTSTPTAAVDDQRREQLARMVLQGDTKFHRILQKELINRRPPPHL
ncbi:Patched-related protein 9 [Trichinella britovi]|uniref:Patched-related protein 9 n=1 Tax=Trichinella britovi TaxID=45882 RepID=A0A0V1DIN7_TRIBR|nr:Patched-related protein 9 [Trichinella britovi]